MITEHQLDSLPLGIATFEDNVRADTQVTVDTKDQLSFLNGEQPQAATQSRSKR